MPGTFRSVGFNKSERLLKPVEYKYVFKKSKRYSCQFFTVLVRINSKSHPRLGLVISKKVSKSAVQRNRIKRLIRESFRLHKTLLPSVDLIIMAKKSVVNQENKIIFQALEKHWKNVANFSMQK